MTDIAVKGLKELDKFLSALPKNMQKNAYGTGLRRAAKVVQDEARLRAPKQTGRMAASIKYGSVHRTNEGYSIFVRLDPKGNNHAFLGLFHEYGVAPHLIAATGKGEGRVALKKAAEGTGTVNAGVMKIGENYVSGILQHPGHRAQPFMRPALDAKAQEAVAAFAEGIRGYLEGKTGFDAGVVMGEAA